MEPQALVYSELPFNISFARLPWNALNAQISAASGFQSMTWLSGLDNSVTAGVCGFDSLQAAQHFCTEILPEIGQSFGVGQMARIFDALVVREASKDIQSPYFGNPAKLRPGAFVYTEVQANVPFNQAPWRERNATLKTVGGLISKTWLSGLHTNTIGGIDAFDTLENAKAFAIETFPKTAKSMNAAFYTRVFDATSTEAASRNVHSPFYK